jgi:hypothetical protein
MNQVQLRPRPSRSLTASVVALVVLAGAVVLTVASVSRLVDGTWPTWFVDPASSLVQQTWGSTTVLATGAVVLVLGVVLLLAAVVPGRRSGAAIALQVENAEESEVVLTQRGLARLAAAAADEVDGVEHVDVSASSTAVRVLAVTSSPDDADTVRSAVEEAVRSRLDVLGTGPVRPVRSRVRVKES